MGTALETVSPRRAFLRLVLFGVVAGTGIATSVRFLWTRLGAKPIDGVLAGARLDRPWSTLGRAYREQFPAEGAAVTLEELLGIGSRHRFFGAARRRRHVAALIRADVERDRFVLIERWLFTKTEGRLFALSSLRDR